MDGDRPRRAVPRRGELTVADIARLAGVSAPTVSRVINGQAGVAPRTRQRVEETSASTATAGPSRPVRWRSWSWSSHALESLWALEIIRGVEQVAREHELAVVLTEIQGRLTPGKAGEPLHETPSVGATNWTGGLAATRHLLGLGHRRIAVITGPTEWPCCRARLDGYRAAMDTAGASVDPDLVRPSILYVEGGLRDGAELLRLPDPPTAIVTANDLQSTAAPRSG